MDRVLITPRAASGIAPFELEGKLTSEHFDDCGLIYYIGGQSFCENIVTILHLDNETECLIKKTAGSVIPTVQGKTK